MRNYFFGIIVLTHILVTASPAQADPPTVSANRVLWLRSDIGTSTAITGSEIATWQDVTNGKTFTGGAAGTRPIYIDSALNCAKPVLRFDNGSDRLVGNLGQGLTNSTVFILGRYNSTSSSNDYIYSIGASGSNGSQMTLSRDGTAAYHYNGSSQYFGDAVPGNAIHVFSQVFKAVGAGAPFHTAYMDGANLNVAPSAAGYNVTGVMNIGNWSSGGFGMGGDLVEVLIYDAALSDADRISIEAYLAAQATGGPSDPPALLAHWKATEGIKAATGEPVAQWSSQVNATQVLTNGNPANTPTLAGAALNCALPAVRFDGNDQLNGTLASGLHSATIFVVARYGEAESDNDYIYTVGDDTGAGAQMSLSRYAGTSSYHYNGSGQFFGEPIIGQVWHVFSQVYECSPENGASWHRLWVDGVDSNVAAVNAPYLTLGQIVLGNFDSGSFHFIGDIHEMRIYDRAMTDAERQAVEKELLALVDNTSPDLNGSGIVDVDDLLGVINAWGACKGECPPSCFADISPSCTVDVDDLLAIINAWGACE